MPEPSPIRVLVADDHTIVRQGLRALLDGQPDLQVVAEARDGRDAVRLAVELQPDVVVMDLAMPGLNGVDATRRLAREAPAARVVVLSMHASAEYVRPAIAAGARGYLIKGSDLADLVAAIREVAAGKAFVSPEAASVLVDAAGPRGGSAELTGREREVLQLVGEGHSSAAIGEILGVSVKTVEGHRQRLMSKLGAGNVAGLVRHAVRLGLVDPDA
jgi:DNA-binding NarL/FixJ family response regulator